jgi:hypothetical protein
MQRMMVVFEVHLAPSADPSTILSKEVQKETQAQVMTLDEARSVGFGGLPPAPEGAEVRLIACSQRDAKWIQGLLEKSEAVGGYRVHEVG